MGGFKLHKVFAVLLILLLMFSCNNLSHQPENILPIYSTFKSSAIYSSSGDFNGDGKMESIFITKPDENYYISILDKNNLIYKRLNYKAENFNLTIQDINNDNREDIILSTIQNNCENCYVYTVNKDLVTLLSPDIIIANIAMEEIEDYIALECGYTYSPQRDNRTSDIRLYYTELDYSDDGSVFVSEGSVLNKNTNILNIQTTVSIDSMGKVIVKNMNMLPVNN